jgi:hypothetical protein
LAPPLGANKLQSEKNVLTQRISKMDLSSIYKETT